jgi:hypothetical protein
MVRTRLGFDQGEVYVDIGTPVAVNDIVDVKANFNATARDEFSGHHASMRIICERLHGVLQSLYRLLPEHVVAGALAENPLPTKQAVVAAIGPIMTRLREQKMNLKTLAPLTEDQILAAGLRQLRYVKAIAEAGDSIIIKKRPIIDYYAAALAE